MKSQQACGTRATRRKGNEITEGAEFASTVANSVACESNRGGELWNIVLELIADNYDALGKMLDRDFWKENFLIFRYT